MKLEKREFTLNTDEKAFSEYDPQSDMLEIIFRQAEATCAVELTESIILRLDWETSEPLSLSFISISKLIQPSEYGEVHFQLLTDESASREAITEAFLSFAFEKTGFNDRLLFFFAGHGLTFSSQSGEVGFLINRRVRMFRSALIHVALIH